jgi:hypothetical protein
MWANPRTAPPPNTNATFGADGLGEGWTAGMGTTVVTGAVAQPESISRQETRAAEKPLCISKNRDYQKPSIVMNIPALGHYRSIFLRFVLWIFSLFEFLLANANYSC